MKKIVKVLVPALMAAVLCLGITACSDPAIDYSTWTYGDFQTAESATENYWNEKEIAYQFVMREEGNASTFAGVYWGMLNLYKDGSAALWEPSGLVTIDYFDGVEGYDKKYALLEIFYGYWSQTEEGGANTVSFTITHGPDEDVSSYSVEMQASGTTTASVDLAYSGGPIPGFDFDCDGTVQYETWEAYCLSHTELKTDMQG